jgi:hypothetical protein
MYAYNIIKKNIKYYLDCDNFENIIINITKYKYYKMMQAIVYANMIFTDDKLSSVVIKEIIDSNKLYIDSIINATLNGY